MNKFILPILAIILALNTLGVAKPTLGREVVFTQPSGIEVKLVVIGNNYYARTETLDGYTVVYLPGKNAYFYARLNEQKDGLVATELQVGIDEPVGLEKHQRLSVKKRSTKERNARQKKNLQHTERNERWKAKLEGAKNRRLNKLEKMLKKSAVPKLSDLQENAAEGDGADAEPNDVPAPNTAPVNGNKVGLTILAQFPDDPATPAADPINFPASVAKMERFCNEVGYNDDGNTGSVRDYFFDQSEGALTYTMKVTEFVTLPQPRNYYNFSDYPANTTLRDSGEAGNLLIKDAIGVLNAEGFNFDGLTVEGGDVRSTNVFFAGPSSGVWSEGLWPHQWGMYREPQQDVTVDGVTRDIHEYQITNLSNAAAEIGTFIHESGHLLLDYPDLYDTNGGSTGLGRHALMSSGNFSNSEKTPSPINLYLKDVVGWANITDILTTQYLNTTLASTGNVGYRYTNPNNANEFFVIENRGFTAGGNATDRWAQYVPDKGIMIWHVDEGVSHNQNEQMTAAQHYHVSLEQQDGLFELENDASGDSSDLYDNNSNAFNDTSLPDAKWWSGTASGIQVKVNSSPSNLMSVEFGVDGITVLSPNGGELVDVDGSTTITWQGNIVGNVKIDLYKGGVFQETLSANEANDGSYTWTLNGAYALGEDYTIRITSVDDNTEHDTSDAVFSIASEHFVANGVMPAGWTQSAGSNAGWIVSSTESTEGAHSLTNADIGDSQKAEVEFTATIVAGNVTFDAKVDSEQRYDFLRFYIDGVEQNLNAADTSQNGLSGSVAWANYSFPVAAGTHTFKWSYIKDNSQSNGADAAWIDNVLLPKEELTLTAPNGGESIDKDSKTSIKWQGSISGNVKIDLYKGGAFDQTLASNEANDGSYTWNLNGAHPVGTDYTIRISSMNDGALFDTSDADFSITTELFVAGGVVPAGWTQSAGSNAGWIVDTPEASEGIYSLKNADIDDSQKADIEFSRNTVAGNVTFDAKVDSESGFDFLRFYIDGVEQDLDTASATRKGISGSVDWTGYTFPVTAGDHTFKWSYTKDGSVSNGADTAWIDNAVIPAAGIVGITLWKDDNFTGNDPAVVGDSADPDGDGITNLMEYALGLDPNQANLSTGIKVEMVGNTLSIIYPKNTDATDVTWTLQSSPDLGPDNWEPYQGTESKMGSEGKVDMMKASKTLGAGEAFHFMRVKIELK